MKGFNAQGNSKRTSVASPAYPADTKNVQASTVKRKG